MKYAFDSTISPSRISLGTVSIGSDIPPRESFALFDAYTAAGGNFIDTAHLYSIWEENGEGASERTIGEWLRVHGARKDLFLATKGAHPHRDTMHIPRCAPEEIEQDLNESLERLGVDSVDLYFLHRDDPSLPAGDLIETLAAFHRDGRIKNAGVSNWSTARIDEANAYAAQHHLPPLVANQPRWALADRVHEMPPSDNTLDLDEPMRQWHERTGLILTPFTAQAKGFFGADNAAWAKAGFNGPAPRGARYDGPQNRRRLTRAIQLAEEHACTPNQIALAYLLSQPFPVYPIIGTHNPAHVIEALGAADIRLTPKSCATLRNA